MDGAPHGRIRRMTLEDVPRVAHIERASFAIPWTEQALRAEMHNACAIYVVAADDTNGVCGYGGMWVSCDEASVTNIAICPHHRGKGLGTLVLEALRKKAIARGVCTMYLEVRPSNTIAMHMYTKCGFAIIGVRPRYYANDGEDAWTMACATLDRPFGTSSTV